MKKGKTKTVFLLCALLSCSAGASDATSADNGIRAAHANSAQVLEQKRQRKEALQALIASQQHRKEQLAQQTADVDNIQLSIEGQLFKWTQALEAFVLSDLPFYQAERLARLENLKLLLGDPAVDDGERLRKLLEACLIEAEFGASVDAYRSKIDIEGQQREVEVAKIGRLALVFQSPDQSLFGFYHPTKRAWQPLPQKFRNDINRIMRFAKSQAPPSMLVIPLIGESP